MTHFNALMRARWVGQFAALRIRSNRAQVVAMHGVAVNQTLLWSVP